LTGLNPESFVERAFEFHLSAAQALAAHHPDKGNGTGRETQVKACATKNREEREKGFQPDSAATAQA
jgi:hypothetical protein